MDEIDTGTVSSAISALQAQGYSVRRTPGPQQREQSFAFVLHQPRMPRALVGPARSTVFAAWASAQEHAEQAEGAPATAKPGPFFAAELPAAALDVSIIASRFGIDVATAARQVQQLRQQSIFLSATHQVNVQLIKAPFGGDLGDVAWLSIKRRDREVIRDWRELQAIKNAIVGPEHEGFELYPAESRLVDTANQFHLFVFMDRRVRMPVGFVEREVTGAEAARAVGATQRELPERAQSGVSMERSGSLAWGKDGAEVNTSR